MTNKAPSNTWCILPWIHLSTRPNGHMRVCCTANASSVGPTNDKEHGGEVGILKNQDGKPANLNVTDLMSSWNNDYMKNVRRQMLDGQKPPSCIKCYKEEESGYRSKRQWETEYWSKRVDVDELLNDTKEDGSVPPKLYYIDLRLGSKCNLKCVMCSPHDSSLWVKDWQQLYPQIKNENLKELMNWDNKGHVNGANYNWHKNNTEFWEQLYEQIPHMKQLYFAGGEATIIEEHYQLLQKCVDMGYANEIELRYNSNGVELPQRLFDLWKQFKRVRFHYSIDAINEQNDYIRFPSKWEHQLKHFELLDKTDDNVEVTVACAVQALNVYYIPDLIKWKLESNFKKINPYPLGAGMVNFHFVYHPAHLNVKVLPQWFKEKCRKKYENFYGYLAENWKKSGADDFSQFIEHPYGIRRLQSIIKFMCSEDWSNRLPEFQEYINLMDSIRDTSFKTTFVEMKEILE